MSKNTPIPMPSGELVSKELSKAKSIDDLIGKDGAFSRLFGDTLQAMMEAELTEHLGYSKHDASGNNSGNSRNGYRKKTIKTSHGATELAIPRDRNGSYSPEIIEKYGTMSNEIEEKILTLYSKGVSTRDIHDTMKELYGIEVSAGLVSQITDKMLPMIETWKNRPLESVYAIVYFDAVHLNIRIDGKVANRAVYSALAITLEGKKELLGLWVSEGGEGANFWLSVMNELEGRGVKDIFIACIDGLNGFKEAIRSVFPDTEIQRCIIHQIRASMKYVNWKDRKAVMEDLKPVYKAATKEEGFAYLEQFHEKWGAKYPISCKGWLENWEELSTFFNYPQAIRTLIYTTNPVESYHRSVRKATKNKGSFSTLSSALKVVYLATMQAEKKWTLPLHNWNSIINQLAIRFEDRFPHAA